METPLPPDPALGEPTSPPRPPFGSPRPRELRRRPDRGPLGGVCAGLAEYFDLDPVIVRIAAVVLAISGPGLPAYALAWIFVPAATADEPPPARQREERDRGAQVLGIVLLVVATSVLWGGWWSPARRWLFPLGLMTLGAWLLLRRDDPDDTVAPRPPAPPPAPWGPTGVVVATEGAPAAGPAAPGIDGSAAGTAAGDTPATDAGADTGAALGGPPRPPWVDASRGMRPPPHPRGGRFGAEPDTPARRRRRMVGPITFGALLVWAGVAALAHVSLQSGLAIALCILGVGFVLGAFVGGSKALIVPAAVVAGALLVTAVVDIPLTGPVGQQRWSPGDLSELDSPYELSIGEGVVDLGELEPPSGTEVRVDASVGIGHLVVEVPSGVAVEVRAHAATGEVVVFGRASSGFDVSVERSFDGDAERGTLVLDLAVGVGQVEVREVRVPASTPTPTVAPTPTTPSTLR